MYLCIYDSRNLFYFITKTSRILARQDKAPCSDDKPNSVWFTKLAFVATVISIYCG